MFVIYGKETCIYGVEDTLFASLRSHLAISCMLLGFSAWGCSTRTAVERQCSYEASGEKFWMELKKMALRVLWGFYSFTSSSS